MLKDFLFIVSNLTFLDFDFDYQEVGLLSQRIRIGHVYQSVAKIQHGGEDI